MPRTHLLPALGIAAAVGLCGSALAQTGSSPSVPDTTGPTEPAQQMSPSAAGSGSSAADSSSAGSSSGAKSASSSHKKKKKAKTPKPADNDNNATPNSAEPSSAPKQSPQ
jgi:hypothetical protein